VSGRTPPYHIVAIHAKTWMPLIEASELPVVVAPGVLFLQFQHYAPVGMQWRIFYPASARNALQFEGSHSTDTNLMSLAKVVDRIYVPPYEDFVKTHRRFFLIVDTLFSPWMVPKLRADGADFNLRQRDGTQVLYEVTLP